jgi:hypothetical protein
MNEMNTKFDNVNEALKKIMKKLQINEWNKNNNYIFSLLLILNN